MTPQLPLLREIFDKLKRGYHLCAEDGELYDVLAKTPEEYESFFGALGIKLTRHERDFFYFEAEEGGATPKYLPQIAVFAFILIDHLSNGARSIEEAIFDANFFVRNLPHLSNDRYVELLRAVDVTTDIDLRRTVDRMDGLGWVEKIDSEEFRFRRPFHRVLIKCVELSASSQKRETVTAERDGSVIAE